MELSRYCPACANLFHACDCVIKFDIDGESLGSESSRSKKKKKKNEDDDESTDDENSIITQPPFEEFPFDEQPSDKKDPPWMPNQTHIGDFFGTKPKKPPVRFPDRPRPYYGEPPDLVGRPEIGRPFAHMDPFGKIPNVVGWVTDKLEDMLDRVDKISVIDELTDAEMDAALEEERRIYFENIKSEKAAEEAEKIEIDLLTSSGKDPSDFNGLEDGIRVVTPYDVVRLSSDGTKEFNNLEGDAFNEHFGVTGYPVWNGDAYTPLGNFTSEFMDFYNTDFMSWYDELSDYDKRYFMTLCIMEDGKEHYFTYTINEGKHDDRNVPNRYVYVDVNGVSHIKTDHDGPTWSEYYLPELFPENVVSNNNPPQWWNDKYNRQGNLENSSKYLFEDLNINNDQQDNEIIGVKVLTQSESNALISRPLLLSQPLTYDGTTGQGDTTATFHDNWTDWTPTYENYSSDQDRVGYVPPTRSHYLALYSTVDGLRFGSKYRSASQYVKKIHILVPFFRNSDPWEDQMNYVKINVVYTNATGGANTFAWRYHRRGATAVQSAGAAVVFSTDGTKEASHEVNLDPSEYPEGWNYVWLYCFCTPDIFDSSSYFYIKDVFTQTPTSTLIPKGLTNMWVPRSVGDYPAYDVSNNSNTPVTSTSLGTAWGGAQIGTTLTHTFPRPVESASLMTRISMASLNYNVYWNYPPSVSDCDLIYMSDNNFPSSGLPDKIVSSETDFPYGAHKLRWSDYAGKDWMYVNTVLKGLYVLSPVV